MAGPPDYYGVLGVPPTADAEELKAAYRTLSLQFHPDRNPGFIEAAAERMKAITAAYQVLADPATRRDYDEDLARATPSPEETATSGESSARRPGSSSAPSDDREERVQATEKWRLEAPALAFMIDHPTAEGLNLKSFGLGMLKGQTKKRKRWQAFERDFRQAIGRRAARLATTIQDGPANSGPRDADELNDILSALEITLPGSPLISESNLSRVIDASGMVDPQAAYGLLLAVESALRAAAHDPPIFTPDAVPLPGEVAADHDPELRALIDIKLRAESSRAVRLVVKAVAPTLDRLPEVVRSSERVLNVAAGGVRGYASLMAVTDQRVLVLTHSRGRVEVDEVPVEEITSVRSKGSVAGSLKVYTATRSIQINGIVPSARQLEIRRHLESLTRPAGT